MTECKRYEHIAPGTASAAWRCSLDLPHSFSFGDGQRIETTATASTKDEASELACRRAVAVLLSTSPGDFVLRPAHWRISPDELLERLPGTDTVHQALPVHVRARSLEAGVDAAELTESEVNERVAALVRWCLNAHGGAFNPARISRKALGQEPGEEPVYSQLNKLLTPGQLRSFVDSHPEFSWSKIGQRGMLITWALQAQAAGASIRGVCWRSPTAPPDQSAPSSASAAIGSSAEPAGASIPDQTSEISDADFGEISDEDFGEISDEDFGEVS